MAGKLSTREKRRLARAYHQWLRRERAARATALEQLHVQLYRGFGQ